MVSVTPGETAAAVVMADAEPDPSVAAAEFGTEAPVVMEPLAGTGAGAEPTVDLGVEDVGEAGRATELDEDAAALPAADPVVEEQPATSKPALIISAETERMVAERFIAFPFRFSTRAVELGALDGSGWVPSLADGQSHPVPKYFCRGTSWLSIGPIQRVAFLHVPEVLLAQKYLELTT